MILGLDTATAGTAVALWAPDGPAVERRDDPTSGARPAHAQRLLPLVEEVLAAVGVGPGGFTGLRLGIATARALAQARRCELVGVSSLEALANGGRFPVKQGDSPPLVVAAIDARRGEVFAAAYPGFGPVALAPAELARRLQPGSLTVGDGAVRFREELERVGAAIPADDSPLHRVSALQICRLGANAEAADRDALLPDYRREPDAKPRQL
jgi:tRNA threonylcarbamoyladenosine biosynthesis protein TsaB